MQHNLREFLRHGGSGQYVLSRQNGAAYGHRAGISIKSLLPGYADLRADFASGVQEEALRRQFEEWPIEGLREVIIIRRDGTIGRL